MSNAAMLTVVGLLFGAVQTLVLFVLASVDRRLAAVEAHLIGR